MVILLCRIVHIMFVLHRYYNHIFVLYNECHVPIPNSQFKALKTPMPTRVAEIAAMPNLREPILYLVAPCMIACSCLRKLFMPV